MALHVWAPLDTLNAADLNANFAAVNDVSIRGIATTAGAATPLPAGFVQTDLAYGAVAVDVGGLWDGSKIVAPQTGIYAVFAGFTAAPGAGTVIGAVVGIAGGVSKALVPRHATQSVVFSTCAVGPVNAGTTLKAVGFSENALALTLTSLYAFRLGTLELP